MSCQTAAVLLVLSDAGEQTSASIEALAATFHLSKADLEWFARKLSLFSPSRGAASLKVAVYAGRKGTTCGVSSGRLLGKATISLDLKGTEAKPAMPHSGWISIGKHSGKDPSTATKLSLTVRAEPDPCFVFEFDSEPECSPQVLQVRGTSASSASASVVADSLGYRFELLLLGDKFSIDLSAAQPLSRGSTPGCSPRGSGDFSQWPLGNYRGFVMLAAVQGEGRCSKPTEDAAVFVALAAAVDLSIHVMSTPHQRNMYMWTPRHPKPGWFRMRG